MDNTEIGMMKKGDREQNDGETGMTAEGGIKATRVCNGTHDQ